MSTTADETANHTSSVAALARIGPPARFLDRFTAQQGPPPVARRYPSAQLQACAKILRDHRQALSQALTLGTTHRRENRFNDQPAQLLERAADSLDLLIRYLQGERQAGPIYVSQRVFELTQLERTREANRRECQRAVLEEEKIYLTFLEGHVTASALESFRTVFVSLTAALVTEASSHVNALFIGDCLLREILGFAIGSLMAQGISVDPFPINPRDPAQLEQILSRLSTKAFDVVLFSPFSHARLAELAKLLDPSMVFASRKRIDALVTAIIAQTHELLAALSQRFECPIFIHNAGLVVRARSAVRLSGRLLLTGRARALAGSKINDWLEAWIATANATTFPHLFLLAERDLVRKFGRLALGRFLSTSRYEHAAVFSRALAVEYETRISAVGRLLGRKLVICDLDDTLWRGAIGEGQVVHFRERQRSLKRLKQTCGVVLSIASKNDPANVHFDGALLSEADFVAPQISWGSKSAAVAKIRSALNLQTRHMVFLDDRAEERAIVCETFPDILALDPADPQTWKSIDLWADMTTGSSDLDRTQLYREQGARAAVVAADPKSGAMADSGTLHKLGLVLTIGTAQRSDLKRIAELINRTNQWNLCGTRTSFEQVRAWYCASDVTILVGRVADRFGDMGSVCVAVVTANPEHADIPVFVLSCRAFGYGIESAMLAEIARRLDIGGQRQALRGLRRASAQNQPCHNMYLNHGFADAGDGGTFEWRGSPPMPQVPWLKLIRIESEPARRQRTA